MPLSRIVAAGFIVMIAIVAGGCSDSGDGAADAPTTVGVTRTVTVTSSGTVTAPLPIVFPASTEAVFFRTPSRNIVCIGGRYGGPELSLRCLLREESWPSSPPRPADCEYDWVDSVIGIGDGAVFLGACLSDVPWGCIGGSSTCDAVVPWGGSIEFGDRIRCTAQRTGLECSDRSGEGFVVAREGYEITS